MKKLFEKTGIEINEKQLFCFEKYYELLTEYNNKFNITAITEKKEVYIKNFIDSIIFSNLITGKTHIDIGSGGGFPAIPLKIIKPELKLTLLEATGKKCEFLNALIESLNLTDVKVVNGRAEEYANQRLFRENFDICTARAVARLNILTEYCLPFVKVGGIFIAYKAQAEQEIQEAENAIKTLGGKIKQIKTVDLMGNTRTAVVIEKVSKTEEKYPRTNAQIRKNPL